MTRLQWFQTAIIATSLLQYACVSPAPTAKLELLGGAQATTNNFPSTVFIPDCSAVKIADRLFLTAAHCVVDETLMMLEDEFAPNATLSLRHGPLSGQAGTYPTTIVNTLVHPSYIDAVNAGDGKGVSSKQLTNLVDLALIVVNEATPSIPAATISWKTPAPGTRVAFGSYGCDDDPFNAAKAALAASDGQIDEDSNQHRLVWIATSVQELHSSNFEISRGQVNEKLRICSADPGGPIYEDPRSKEGNTKKVIFKTIIGINSTRGPVSNGFVRLDKAGTSNVAACLKKALTGKFPNRSNGSLPLLCDV